MAITIALFERTPYRLAWLLTAAGGTTTNPDSGVIYNRDAAPAGGKGDLRYEAGTFNGSAIDNLVNTTPITTNAEARTLLMGSGLTAVGDLPIDRGHLTIMPVGGDPSNAADSVWTVDAQAGVNADAGAPPAGSTGYACIVFTGPGVSGPTALLTLEYQHSFSK